jgi:hypothetical protein
VVRPSPRLAAGALCLALPLGAVAGCGAVKQRTIKQELTSAQENLGKAEAVSLTLRVDDSKGALKALATKDGDVPKELVDELLSASVTYTFGTGSGKLKDVSTDTQDLEKVLQDVRFGFAIKVGTTTLGEIRLVDSALYARADLDEIARLAEKGGAEDASVDELIADAPEDVQPALEDVRAGKWLKLPLEEYLDQVKELAGDLPTPAPGTDTSKIGKELFEALKPHVTVTAANDDSSHRVLNVDVTARAAAKALIATIKQQGDNPLSGFLGDVSPTDVDDAITDGTVKGTLTLEDGHLTQVAIDLESIRTLEPGA